MDWLVEAEVWPLVSRHIITCLGTVQLTDSHDEQQTHPVQSVFLEGGREFEFRPCSLNALNDPC